ncbi:MAG: type IV pilus twitching motility protein PilT [Elusimicrobia bacterium]|nr:type IV pilus twitching motility protein PilT [Elusimicrobiota bacterium]MDE2426554.1 type IV pilus twitching motility protein PilT [Elusimicrobiota bacterium]
MISMSELFLLMHERGASDLHLTVGAPPMLRIDGQLVPTPFEKLTHETSQTLVFSLLTEQQRQRYEANNELDLAFGLKGIGRLRVNIYRQRGSVGAAVRAIPAQFKTFEEIGLPQSIYDIIKIPKGLILVTGPTGSGKSTTLASMIDYINEHRTGHIVTVEDPIEYVHSHKKSIVNQREVGQDTESFAASLKHVLRQDPNVILIGELRDLETISAALTIAETGHLVLATLHTNDCAQTINRVIDVFPQHQIEQVRVQLSFVLQAVICQQLLVHASGQGRVLAAEILMATSAIRNLIREQKIEQVQLAIQTGGKFGMQTMNQSLADLYRRQRATLQEVMAHSLDPEDLRRLLQRTAAPA